MLISNFILCLFFYLLGSIPFALITPKIFGFGDIRINHGDRKEFRVRGLENLNKLVHFFQKHYKWFHYTFWEKSYM